MIDLQNDPVDMVKLLWPTITLTSEQEELIRNPPNDIILQAAQSIPMRILPKLISSVWEADD